MKVRVLSLRPICPADAVDLQHNCFPEQSPDDVRVYLDWCLAQMDKGRMVRLVAEVDGRVVANGQLTVHRSKGEIGSLVVAKPHRRRGIGKALLGALIAEARRRGLHEIEIAADAKATWVQAWYEGEGFVPVEERVLPGDERVVVLCMALCRAQGAGRYR